MTATFEIYPHVSSLSSKWLPIIGTSSLLFARHDSGARIKYLNPFVCRDQARPLNHVRSRLFNVLLFRAASTIGANIHEIIGENTGELIGVAAKMSRPTLRFECQNQVCDGILSWCLSREYNEGEEERCQHAARAPNGVRLSCAAVLWFSQLQFYYDGRRQLQPLVRLRTENRRSDPSLYRD